MADTNRLFETTYGLTSANLFVGGGGATFASNASFSSTTNYSGLATFASGVSASYLLVGLGGVTFASNASFSSLGSFSAGITSTNLSIGGGGATFASNASFSSTTNHLGLATFASGASASYLLVGVGGATFSGNLYAPNIVNSVNGITAGVSITAGTNITLTQSANIITIAASSGGASTNSTTQTLDFSQNTNGLEIVFYDLGQDLFTSLQYVENNKTITASIDTNIDNHVGVIRSIKSFYDAVNGWSARLILVPLWNQTNATAETILAEEINVINLNLTSYSGTNVVDSWNSIASSSVYNQEETYVTKTVTGQAWVAADSYIVCNVLGLTTADHTPEDAILEGVKFNINNIVAGTGFDIIGHAPEGTYGKYTVKCLGQ